MRKILAGLLAVTLSAGFCAAVSPGASAAPAPGGPATVSAPDRSSVDNLPNPLADKQTALRQEAITGVLNGELTPQVINGSTVVKVGSADSATTASTDRRSGGGQRKDKYVELKREQTDRIFVILAEFGNERHPLYPDQDTDPDTAGPTVFNGPLHNAIPQPGPSDNSTVWQSDFNRAHFEQIYFGTGKGVESLKTYYETQSSGRYSVEGEVTDWVKVRYNEARYGRSDGFPCASNVCSNTWQLVKDAANQWVADQQAAGRTDSQIAADMRAFDVHDRYDVDGDGNFNEPDGYIDHFQIVHAGGDQADGDPQQGEDAIWSHRWYAFQDGSDGDGPAGAPLGGTQIGSTGIWIGDYTIQPENGGRSVFFHEFGHDLGLPDDYDTVTGGGSPTEWWTLMSQSRLSARGEPLGTRAGDLGAWNKQQLGWLDYELAKAGDTKTLRLGPEEYNSRKPQALIVILPKKTVTTDLGAPFEGDFQWWSGAANDLSNSMSRQVTLPADPATLSFQARWNIEDCGPDPCDYAFVEVDDGTGYTAIPGSITAAAEGNGIDGISDGWEPATFDLSAYAGNTVGLRISYVTDGAAQGTDPKAIAGIFVDALTITAGGSTVFADDAETSPNGWTLDGFTQVGATTSKDFDNYYIAGYRTYTSYDRYLKTGPYNFGWATTEPDRVEHFAYQRGLLISYWDTSQSDNNVGVHPGMGLNLYIDAHPDTLYRLDGVPWRTRIQIYDAPFSRFRADSMTLHVNGVASYIRGQRGQPVFDDTKNWFDPIQKEHGVIVANAGVKIRVLSQSGTSVKIRLSTS